MKRLITILFFILTPLSLFGFYGDGSGRSLIDFLMDRYWRFLEWSYILYESKYEIPYE
ncbi:unknown [Brachyspira sp. CAG:700]|nr:unknown [Brachyspira sp. CAG:700]